ncbi:MAG TPA: trypsin-like peptidase domain-containing protein [Planctomycetota bacterium]|nr:trypsin-like peptidase domain-containing protein [Planctomycetota bacterium]
MIALLLALSAATQEIHSDDVVTVLEKRCAKVSQKAAPSVVAIRVEREPEAEKKPAERKPPRRNPLLNPPQEPEDLFAKRPADFWCSGTVIESDGLIATTAFNVSGKVKAITVRLPDGREFEGKVLGSNATDDVALVRIDAKDLPVLVPARVEDLHAGNPVIAVGRAPDGKGLTLNPGIVSAVSRLGGRGVQTDAKLNFGNVGGPLVDGEGRLIAITCKVDTKPGISSTRGQNSGVGYAVTHDELKKILPDLKSGKVVAEPRRPFLGIEADQKSTLAQGVALAGVRPGGAAERAGIKGGDVIIELDGSKITYFDELRAAILRRAPGDHIRVKVKREDKELEFDCELGWAPEE